MSASGHELRGPHFVVSAEGNIHGEDTADNRELARRIHACVNACDGISTEELESGVIGEMRQMIAELVPILQNQQQGRAGNPQAAPSRKVTVNS